MTKQPQKANKTTRERDKQKKDKLLQEELESNKRAIKSFYGLTNPLD